MNKNILLYFSLVPLFFASCTQNPADTAVESDIHEEVQLKMTEITEPGFEMALAIPEEILVTNEPEIYYDEMVGYLKIRLGEEMGIDILDQSIVLEDFKTTLTNKVLFSYNFLDESNQGFMYQSVLPDGEIFSSNFIQKFTLNNKEYYARSATNGEYSIEKVKKMKEIISTAKSI